MSEKVPVQRFGLLTREQYGHVLLWVERNLHLLEEALKKDDLILVAQHAKQLAHQLRVPVRTALLAILHTQNPELADRVSTLVNAIDDGKS